MKQFIIIYSSILLSTIIPTSIIWSQQEITTKIVIPIDQMDNLRSIGYSPVHPRFTESGMELYVSKHEMDYFNQNNIQYKILKLDIHKEASAKALKYMKSAAYKKKSNQQGFHNGGSMGGYFSYSEIVAKLDEMHTRFPAICSEKYSIGKTIENNDIWAIKFSDYHGSENPNEPNIYYDALTHSNESEAGAALLYYMFWLLENYGSDDEATFIIDNRELFFVPVVNPDGYLWNATNPERPQGGFWRLNRRINENSPHKGVNLNRNFSYKWGEGNSDEFPSDWAFNNYRGSEFFSEPESRAIRDFVNSIHPDAAFTIHSFGNGYLDSDSENANHRKKYDILSPHMCHEHDDFIWGRPEPLLYLAGGSSGDYFDSEGIISWTPEIGDEFALDTSESYKILPNAHKHLGPMRYLAKIGGAFPVVKNIWVEGNENLYYGSEHMFRTEILNIGLSQGISDFQLTILPSSQYEIIEESVTIYQLDYNSIETIGYNHFGTEGYKGLRIRVGHESDVGSTLDLQVVVSKNGVVYDRRTISFPIGCQEQSFTCDFEDDSCGIATSGNIPWTVSERDNMQGDKCFIDSDLEHMIDEGESYLRIPGVYPTSSNMRYELSFWIQYSLEGWYNIQRKDYFSLEVSTDAGNNWEEVKRYSGSGYWVKEIIDLSSYSGDLKFRFKLKGDGTQVSEMVSSPDGVSIDEIKITNRSAADPLTIYPIATGRSIINIDINTQLRLNSQGYFIYYDTSRHKIGDLLHIEFNNSSSTVTLNSYPQYLMRGSNFIPTSPTAVTEFFYYFHGDEGCKQFFRAPVINTSVNIPSLHGVISTLSVCDTSLRHSFNVFSQLGNQNITEIRTFLKSNGNELKSELISLPANRRYMIFDLENNAPGLDTLIAVYSNDGNHTYGMYPMEIKACGCGQLKLIEDETFSFTNKYFKRSEFQVKNSTILSNSLLTLSAVNQIEIHPPFTIDKRGRLDLIIEPCDN